MSEETKNESGEILETQKKTRKTLTVGLLILLIGVALVIFAWWYMGGFNFGETRPRQGYALYSKFGFSFEYPESMIITEQGLFGGSPTSNSGTITGLFKNGEIEMITVQWMPYNEPTYLETTLSGIFMGMEMTGLKVEEGQLVHSTKSGDELIYQYFTTPHFAGNPETGTAYGISGVWYCGSNDRLYNLILTYSKPHGILSKFQQYLDSFVCH